MAGALWQSGGRVECNRLGRCPPFVTTEDELLLIAGTITRALDAFPA